MHHAAMGCLMAVQVAGFKPQAQFRSVVLGFDQLYPHFNGRGVIGPEGLHRRGDLVCHPASISCTMGMTFSP